MSTRTNRFGRRMLPIGVTLVFAGCSSGGGTPHSVVTGANSAPVSTASPGAPSSTSAASDVTQLASRLRTGVQSVSSAHLTLQEQAAGQAVTGSGDETLASGKLTAMDLSVQIGSLGQLRALIVGNAVYLQLPPSVNASGKPWVQASASSSNPVIQQIASSISSAQQSASINSLTLFASAATSIRYVGRNTVSGQPTQQYDVTVDVAKLAAAEPSVQAVLNAGITTIPVQLWIDQQDRPVMVKEDLTAQGQSVSVVVTVSNYNAPVNITAPPADQVGTE